MRKMRDSGVAWLGDIPEGWKVGRLGALYTLRNEKVSDKDYPPLSVTMKGIVPQLETAAKSDDGDNRKLVRVGDFAINSRSDRRGSCGISAYDGSVSLINTILTPRGEMLPGYYNWLFHTSFFADEFYRWGHGIVDDLWTTRWSEMKRIAIPLPPLPEQREIAAYLDARCGEIDAAIGEAKKAIEEYKQWKKSLIFEVVTGKRAVGNGGAGPAGALPRPRRTKPSGIAWLGEVPEGWDVRRLKFLFDEITDGSHFSPPAANDGYPYITATDVRGVGIDYGKAVKIDKQSYEKLVASGCKIYKNDVLIVKDGATTGRVGFMSDNIECVALSSVAMLRSNKHEPKYLMYLLMSELLQEQILVSMAGSAMPRTTISKLKEYVGFLPPLAEQREIAAYLDARCGEIDAAVAERQRLIADLEAYKKALIFETVTGKREVA